MNKVRASRFVLVAILAACTAPVPSEAAGGTSDGKFDRGPGIEGFGESWAPSNEPRIVGGERTSDYPAVVALLDDGQKQFCTGTLIGARTVLTAAHCVDSWTPVAAVYFGSDAELGSVSDPDFVDEVPVVRSAAHPDYYYDAVAEALIDDFAVLELERAPSNVEPMAINDGEFKDSMIGASLILVGFGNTDANGTGGGRKRVTETELDSFTDGTLYWADRDHNTCHGDSGGPAFFDVAGTLVQVGITSYGDPDCREDGVDMRVDDALAFIEEMMTSIGDTPVYVDASSVTVEGDEEPNACEGTYYDEARVCRHENGTFARAECCEMQCFEAYLDSANRCRRGDGKFAPAFCCE